MIGLTPFDRLLAQRTVAFTALAGALAYVVVAATDEAYSTAAMRLARMAALAPALIALGIAGACSQASARSELRALAALGLTPSASTRGARVAGWLLGALAVSVVAAPSTDVSSLFPIAQTGVEWSFDGTGFQSTAGLWISSSGELVERSAARGVARPMPHRIDAVVIVASLATAVPVWASVTTRTVSRAIAVLLTTALVIFVFHGLATGSLNTAAATLVVAPLLVHAWMNRAKSTMLAHADRG